VVKATEVTTGLAESNGLWHDLLHVTCGLIAYTPRSALGPTLGNEYGVMKNLQWIVLCSMILCLTEQPGMSGPFEDRGQRVASVPLGSQGAYGSSQSGPTDQTPPSFQPGGSGLSRFAPPGSGSFQGTTGFSQTTTGTTATMPPGTAQQPSLSSTKCDQEQQQETGHAGQMFPCSITHLPTPARADACIG